MIDLRYGRDVLDALREIPDGVVQCCVTSPPYYGLRDYKTGRWEGGDPGCSHEPTAEELMRMVTASSTVCSPHHSSQLEAARSRSTVSPCKRCGATRVDSQIGREPTLDEFLARLVAVFREVRRVLHPTGIAWVNMGDSYGGEKALLNVPYRLAFALADDGWLHRDTVIWHKPAPMPESVRDRCTKAWEPIFMFTRQPRYFADMEGVRVNSPRSASPEAYAAGLSRAGSAWYPNADGDNRTGSPGKYAGKPRVAHPNGANLRNVWRMASEPYKGAHFATFPSDLPRRCLKIGTSPRGCCPTCRSPWKKEQSCRCPAAEPIPCTVLDPFCGSGTTMRVAAELGLDGIGIDLSSDYLPLARERVGALHLGAA